MAWGSNITTKLYLNTNLKPMTIGERKNLYPLYVRVICKQQVAQFKYFGKDLEPKYYSKQEFEDTYGLIDFDVNDASQLTEKSLAVALITSFKNDIDFLLNFLEVFDREKFNIKELPSILKSYYEAEKSVLALSTRLLIKEMLKKGYEPLISVIDWSKQHPKGIEMALNAFQEDFKLPLTKINYNNLPFFHIKEALELVKNQKAHIGSTKTSVEKIMSSLDTRKTRDLDALLFNALTTAIEFYKSSIKLISGNSR